MCHKILLTTENLTATMNFDLISFYVLTGHSKRQVIRQQTLEVHLERGTGHLRETEVINSTPVEIF